MKSIRAVVSMVGAPVLSVLSFPLGIGGLALADCLGRHAFEGTAGDE